MENYRTNTFLCLKICLCHNPQNIWFKSSSRNIESNILLFYGSVSIWISWITLEITDETEMLFFKAIIVKKILQKKRLWTVWIRYQIKASIPSVPGTTFYAQFKVVLSICELMQAWEWNERIEPTNRSVVPLLPQRLEITEHRQHFFLFLCLIVSERRFIHWWMCFGVISMH